ncbi:MAG TPA: lipid IV(A) 3-deoxy-D-manno-octulosonic acid transferase [Usitatibacter sp.]|nr:lipid IV(A) 3-deoxy-D-manno-octulosonic acid transferase [Usitatibacter sp.]
MTRLAYALLWFLAAPFVVVRLAWRSRRQPGYLEKVGERFGRYEGAPLPEPCIWVHAVSVGETRAAAPLVAALRERHPDRRILVTHMTPTGRATGRELFGDTVERAWLPYDLGFAVRRFLDHYRPEVGIVMETEIWPRLLEEAARRRIPVVLANGRMSERSARRYERVPALTRWAMGNLAGVAAQTDADAKRFERLGARAPAVIGNVKFDVAVPQAMLALGRELRGRIGERPVWLAASTREGEEALLLDAFAQAGAAPEVLLLIVPRHPQRFDEVAKMAAARGFEVARRSEGVDVPPGVRVLVGDSMGEMLAYCAASDLVAMGGSFLEYGGQNLIEACAVGRPVIVGPSTYNFEEAAKGAVEAGAALRVADAREAMAAAQSLTSDRARREGMGRHATDFVAAHRGAVARLADWIEAAAKAPR